MMSFSFVFLDINECALNTDNCHNFANCSNTVGSFQCRCNIGYEGDGVNCRGKLVKNFIILN